MGVEVIFEVAPLKAEDTDWLMCTVRLKRLSQPWTDEQYQVELVQMPH